jgi:hypothetical protein
MRWFFAGSEAQLFPYNRKQNACKRRALSASFMTHMSCRLWGSFCTEATRKISVVIAFQLVIYALTLRSMRSVYKHLKIQLLHHRKQTGFRYKDV